MVSKRNSLLLVTFFIAGCTSSVDMLGAGEVQPFPPDTSCSYSNPHAEYDETIIELCDGNDNNCDCLAKPLEEQDTNGDLQRCGPGDDGVDEGCECWPENQTYTLSWANGERDCWLDEEGRDLGELESHTNPVGKLHGECKYGTQTCRPLPAGGSEWGIWLAGYDRTGGTEDDEWVKGGCLNAVGPLTEACDGKDNNCDTRIDEGLKRMCWSGPTDPDGTPQDWLVFSSPLNSFSPCRTGVELCQNARWSGCLSEVLPAPESCDGIDNDCDGDVDDGAQYTGEQCGLTDAGICDYGTMQCVGADLICEEALLPQTEECDNVDNDCDGDVDEGLFRPCQTVCGSGIETCSAGQWVNCNAQQPVEEICDAEDNDCDGLIDEELECTCPPEFLGMLLPCQSNPRLTCGAGFMECICQDEDCAITAFTECQALCAYEPQVQEDCDPTLGIPQPEKCNAWDDDCDGDIDEGLVAECYTGPRETAGVGQCAPGNFHCFVGRWGNENDGIFIDELCLDQILPEDEICDHADNDCDGDIDEDLDSHEKVDMVFAIDRSGSMCGKIHALREGIQPYVLEFANTPHRFALVNIPGPGFRTPPDVEIGLVDSLTFANALAQIGCDMGNVEPQYDAIESIALNSLGLNFRDDAWPMVVMMSDENAQTFRNLTAVDVRASIDPCTIGNCEPDDVLEVYAIIQNVFASEWCAPANIAQKCYQLYLGIDAATVRGYLDDIFSDVCR
jgi:hypothetical protein